jgi:HEPN domain-containing protein
MKITHEDAPEDWFASALDRLQLADLGYERYGATTGVIELLQEATERYLKGYLISRGWQLERTHRLSLLLEPAIEFDERFATFRDFAESLTEQFFASHYPGGDISEVGNDYGDLRKQAGDLIDLIRPNQPHIAED